MQTPPHEFVPLSVRTITLWHFITVWILLHSGVMAAVVLSGYAAIFTVPLILWGYMLLLRRYMPYPGGWMVTTVIGLVGGSLLGGAIIPYTWLGMAAAIGIVIGTANLLVLPWRGVRTLCWPLVTMVSMIAGTAVMIGRGLSYSHDPEAVIGMLLLSGALYGLITGPVLYRLVHGNAPTTV